MSKGSNPRPMEVDREEFNAAFDRIFGGGRQLGKSSIRQAVKQATYEAAYTGKSFDGIIIIDELDSISGNSRVTSSSDPT